MVYGIIFIHILTLNLRYCLHGKGDVVYLNVHSRVPDRLYDHPSIHPSMGQGDGGGMLYTPEKSLIHHRADI